jgi:hypothetical protein
MWVAANSYWPNKFDPTEEEPPQISAIRSMDD